MILSLSLPELCEYLTKQVNFFYPDKFIITPEQLSSNLKIALDRLEFCFSKVINHRYNNGSTAIYNHLYADHNVMLYWFLSNTIWEQSGNKNLSSKFYYLNKSLHGFDCMFDTNLPNIFLIFHGVGTMLGKATYDDFFIAMQGCTVGAHKNKYPVFGKGVSLTSNSSVIGDCRIGDRCNISSGTQIFQKNMQNNQTAFINSSTGLLEIVTSKSSYGEQFFNSEYFND